MSPAFSPAKPPVHLLPELSSSWRADPLLRLGEFDDLSVAANRLAGRNAGQANGFGQKIVGRHPASLRTVTFDFVRQNGPRNGRFRCCRITRLSTIDQAHYAYQVRGRILVGEDEDPLRWGEPRSIHRHHRCLVYSSKALFGDKALAAVREVFKPPSQAMVGILFRCARKPMSSCRVGCSIVCQKGGRAR